MCGISGILGSGPVDEAAVARLIRPLAHRGPDDEGIWVDPDAGVGLGHRRLAIVDLSPAGHQPMISDNGRYVLTFNGEIYNHPDLKRDLEADGAVPDGGWRGHSDTELFLQAIATWGLEDAVRRSAGMFAFALWDRKDRTLSLVRDRFGEKPLYYGWAGRDFVFGSELKALRSHPAFDHAIDRRALRLFASRTNVPAPFSIYRRVFKLLPGCILTLTPEAAREPLDAAPAEGVRARGLRLTRYWSYRDVVLRGLDDPIADESEALAELERVLARSIRGQSMADVPVGAFLSGGIDSSTVCALYQKYSSRPIRTFSIGFEEAGFDEAPYAKRVAAHLGTVHSEHYVTVREAREVIPSLPTMYDEPFADSSQIPTHLVSRHARQQVTVALTGDGGDELFGGYRRHFAAPRLWRQLSRVPRPLRALAGAPLSRVPPQVWSSLANAMPGRRPPHIGARIQQGFRFAGAESFDQVYGSLLDRWSSGPSPVIGGDDAALPVKGIEAPDVVRVMYRDAVTYLPDDILAKVDRASMAVALETRVPFLDHRVAAFAARIPLDLKIRGGQGKRIVRKLLATLVPPELIERPKAGFQLPVGEWLRGPLRPWAEALLEPAALRSQGWLDPDIVGRCWRNHSSGRSDSTEALWAILTFQAWLDEQRSVTAEAA
jgi:asparagine synthase (glutamine-hydrolysing)